MEQRTKIIEAKCPDHGVREHFLMSNMHGIPRPICDIPSCGADLATKRVPERTEIIEALRTLLRFFVRGTIDAGYNAIEVTKRNRKARITHLVDKGELWVCNVNLINGGPDHNDQSSKFELNDPRSIAVAIRSLCRRLGDDMPSFEEVDRVLEEGPPAWMLEE